MSLWGKLTNSILFFLISSSSAFAGSSVLETMNITPSPQSIDYVNNKKQFQLYSLITEQRHPKTYHLSYQIAQSTTAGLQSLLAVDRDISVKLQEIANNPQELKNLEAASQAIQTALLNGQKIYFYGTGSTGRLAEAVESALWRPFWEKVAQTPAWSKINTHLPNIQNQLKGEITGGDRALISSLEGFEDLQLIGKLQLQDNKIQKGDVVFAVTEGGETSAVIGTILAAAKFYNQPTENLYFIYNNPDSVLLPFDRSRSVIENPFIRKINLTTGPQAITGSTRMQATTISLYVSGVILEDAVYRVLQRYLSQSELAELGFNENLTIKKQLLDFANIQEIIYDSAAKIAPWTDLEAQTYATQHKTTYFAQKALLPVFVDVTERSPTFRIPPLDTINAKEKHSWLQVWAPADTSQQAWDMLLHRSFHGLDPAFYQQQFSQNIEDPYLRETALTSLTHAGQEQQNLYDLSFSPQNIKNNGPVKGDLGVMILLSNESLTTRFMEWLKVFSNAQANLVLVSVSDKALPESQVNLFKNLPTKTVFLSVIIPRQDPFALSQMIGLKMLLNANSTAIMAKLGRVVGNTMTDVQPSNLKLIGRATYLIQMHVNAVLSNPAWIKLYGKNPPLTFAEANAVLFSAIDYVQKTGNSTEAPEVALSIFRILESLKQHKNFSWQQAQALMQQENLDKYLASYE